MTMLNLFVGYDSKEPVAYHVLAHSILRRASIPVSITPVSRKALSSVYTKPRGEKESTEFSMTRFLVPWLSGYKGYSIFLDCDFLCNIDVAILDREIEERWRAPQRLTAFAPTPALAVCKHEYETKQTIKFFGQANSNYPRKNWSSFMIFSNEQCQKLTPERVNTLSGLELHRFAWLEDAQIGSLPFDYNWLQEEYDANPDAKFFHWTLGGPWFQDHAHAPQADLWREEYRHMTGQDWPLVATAGWSPSEK